MQDTFFFDCQCFLQKNSIANDFGAFSKMVSKRLNVNDSRGTSYFSFRDSVPGAMYKIVEVNVDDGLFINRLIKIR
jgi:hypothetical protein